MIKNFSQIPDKKLKLAIINQLVETGDTKPDMTKIKDLAKKAEKAGKDYEFNPDILKVYLSYEPTDEQLAALTKLTWGTMSQAIDDHYLYPHWDGEDDEFTIKKLDGIELLPNLKELHLDLSTISDISLLKSLTQLEKVSLTIENVSDISVLLSLTKLKRIRFDGYKGFRPTQKVINDLIKLFEKKIDIPPRVLELVTNSESDDKKRLNIINAFIEKFPKNYALLKERAKIYYRDSNYKGVIEDYTTLLSLDPSPDEKKEYLRSRAQSYHYDEQNEKALKDLQALHKLGGTFGSYELEYQVYQELELYEEALDALNNHFDEMTKTRKRPYELSFYDAQEKCDMLMKLKKYPEALKIIEYIFSNVSTKKWTGYDHFLIQYYEYQAKCYEELGEYPKQLEALENVFKHADMKEDLEKVLMAHNNKANTLHVLKKDQEARKAIEAGLKLRKKVNQCPILSATAAEIYAFLGEDELFYKNLSEAVGTFYETKDEVLETKDFKKYLKEKKFLEIIASL